MSADSSGDVDGRRVAWAVLLIAMALLAFELVITRVFSVILWNHFAFLAISVALFGLGIAGTAVYLLPRTFGRENALQRLRVCSLVLPATLWIAVGVLCALPIRMDFSQQMFTYLIIVFVTAALPFVVGGLAVALALTHWPREVNRIYAFDLLGSALGCILVIALLDQLDGPAAALALGVLPALAAFVLKRSWTPVAVMLTVIVGVGVNASVKLIRVRIARSNLQQNVLYERWNAFSRVNVVPFPRWRGWWVAPNNPEPPIDTLGVGIDADAFTALLRYDGDDQKVRVLLSDITSPAYHLRPNAGAVMIVGAGGGKDVLTALLAGAQRVRAVELNPIIARDLVSDRFKEFTGDLYHNPRVDLVVGEGRTVLRHDTGRYDVIQISMVDTSAASAAGAYALTENSLYTLEAAEEFLGHLTNNGIVTTTWLNLPNLQGGIRLVALYSESLRRKGLDPVTRIAVLSSPTGHVTVLSRLSPYLPEEVVALRNLSTQKGFLPLYLPGDPLELPSNADVIRVVIRKLIAGKDLESLYDSYRLDVRPVTDDRPFFFYQQRFRDAGWALTHWNVGYLYGNGLFILVKLLVISGLAVLIFMVLPLLVARGAPWRTLRGQAPLAVYFLCLGVGFIVLEITLVQMFSYYLGHPLLGLSVSLASLLLFTGAGSYLSGQWGEDNLARRLHLSLGALICLGGLYFVAVPALISATLAANTATRISVVVLLLAPLGVLLGCPFPSGLRLLQSQTRLIPWMWTVNAGATVFGSVLATMMVIHLGFAYTLLIGTGVYGIALVAILRAPTATALDAAEDRQWEPKRVVGAAR